MEQYPGEWRALTSAFIRDNFLMRNYQTVISPLGKKKTKNFRLNDCPHHLFPLTVLFYFTCPDYFVCLSVFESCHPFKHHQYWSCHCVCLRALILFITEIISLPLPSLQFQIIKNRTSSSGEKRPDLDLGFWVAMNQGNLWVSCLPALSCPSQYSKNSKPIGISDRSPRFESH